MLSGRKVLPLAVTALLSVSLAAPPVEAQQDNQDNYRAPTTFAGKTVVLPIGTTFEGRIQSTIGSRASHSGQSFKVEISAPVMANGTDILIPSGAEIQGEVAEAISSSSQPHDRNMVAPLGKLRVQLHSLKMPDGKVYPLVGSFAPDGSRGGHGDLTPRKSSVAYVGTQAGFDAVNPANQNRQGRGRMQVQSKSSVMSDPILGDTGGGGSSYGQVRALVRKGRELVILSGSSMTVRLDAPLKLAFGASSAQQSIQDTQADEPGPSRGKHFSKTRKARESSQNAPQADDNMAQTGNGDQSSNQPASQGAGQTVAQPQGRPPVEQPGSSF